MSRIRHEGAGIGDHANEGGEQPAIRKRIQLPLHRLFLVEKPPAAAKLDLTGHSPILKIADHGGESIIVCRVSVINNHLGKGAGMIQSVKVGSQRLYLWPISYRIKSFVPSHAAHHSPVHVAVGAKMQLLGPSFLRIQMPEKNHQKTRE